MGDSQMILGLQEPGSLGKAQPKYQRAPDKTVGGDGLDVSVLVGPCLHPSRSSACKKEFPFCLGSAAEVLASLCFCLCVSHFSARYLQSHILNPVAWCGRMAPG